MIMLIIRANISVCTRHYPNTANSLAVLKSSSRGLAHPSLYIYIYIYIIYSIPYTYNSLVLVLFYCSSDDAKPKVKSNIKIEVTYVFFGGVTMIQV